MPIALGILAASSQLPAENLNQYEFVGELALSGELRPVRGVLPIALAAHRAGRNLIVPADNAAEAALVNSANVFYAKHLLEVCAHLQGEKTLPRCESRLVEAAARYPDMKDVRGQPLAKRALEAAAAASIVCYSSGRQVQAKRCSPVACRVFCRKFPPQRL